MSISKQMVMQNCGKFDSVFEYEDWKAGQEALKDVSGFTFSFYNEVTGKVTAFYDIGDFFSSDLKKSQKKFLYNEPLPIHTRRRLYRHCRISFIEYK